MSKPIQAINRYKADLREMFFLLFEQFRLQDLLGKDPFEAWGEEEIRQSLSGCYRWVREVTGPLNVVGDTQGCRIEDGRVKTPDGFKDAWQKLFEAGWKTMGADPEHGGAGAPYSVTVLIEELCSGANTSFTTYPGLAFGVGEVVAAFGTPEQKHLYCARLFDGRWAGTMCLTEPHAGSDVGSARTVARKNGDGSYALSGTKCFITGGDQDLTENIIHLVLARVPGDPETTKGISLFAVPKRRIDKKGAITGPNDVATTGIEHKMGINASSTCALSFGDNNDCEGYLIGQRCEGIVYMFQMMNEARIVCGVQGVALGSRAYEMARAYAAERKQGTDLTKRGSEDRVAIIDHPDVRRNLLMAKAFVEGTRALLLQAAVHSDVAHNHPDPRERDKNQDLLELLTPVCKAYATDKGFKVTELAIQVHGGYGYVKEYGVEQCMRDVKIASLYDGTNGIQALDLLGRKMKMKGGGVFLTWLQEANAFLKGHAAHGTLGDLVAEVDRAKNMLAEVAFGFAMNGNKDPGHTLLSATPFLDIFGHVEIARLLVHQAIISADKLAQMASDRDVEGAEALGQLILDNPDARFYDGKVKTARFFVHNILPEVDALVRSIKSGDRSALEIVF